MAQLQLKSKFKVKNQVITPDEIRNIFLLGVKTVSPSGQEITDDIINTYIDVAVREIEMYFSIKLRRQIVKERRDYIDESFIQWGYLRTSYQVVCPKSLSGWLAMQKHIEYPKEWLNATVTNQQDNLSRNFYLVPNTSNFSANQALYTQLYGGAFALFYRTWARNTIPNYWEIEYLTGYDKLPPDLFNLLGRLVSVKLLPTISDFITRIPGSAGQSISLDGLTQTYTSVVSAKSGVYAQRMNQYLDEIKVSMKDLRDFYMGVNFIAL